MVKKDRFFFDAQNQSQAYIFDESHFKPFIKKEQKKQESGATSQEPEEKR
jgi:hypothetical protein